jgi:hypothetical protein
MLVEYRENNIFKIRFEQGEFFQFWHFIIGA